MAGIAKPNIPELGKETTVNFLSSRTDYTPNFRTELFDGNISSTNSLNSALFLSTRYTGCFVEFEVTEKCRIWGYTLDYSDSGGNLLNPCALYKKDENTNQYVFVKNSNTPVANQWYSIFDELEVGTYKIQSSDNTNYCGWSEWYIEQLEKENINPLTIKKTLKDNLPTSIDSSRDELHFTEDGGIYLSKNDGTLRQVGVDDETIEKIADIEDKINDLSQNGGTGGTGVTIENIINNNHTSVENANIVACSNHSKESSLLVWYDFDKYDGGKTIKDESGNLNNSLSIVKSPTFEMDDTLGRKVAVFNGTTSYIPMGTSLKVPYYTYSIMAYKDNWEVSKIETLISCTQTGGYSTTIVAPSGGSKIKTQAYVSGGYKSVFSPYLSSQLSAGWHTFTTTNDGYEIRLYIDGVLTEKLDITGGTGTRSKMTFHSSNGVLLGAEASTDHTPESTGYWFNGKMAEVRFYEKPLTDSDIFQMHEEMMNHKNPIINAPVEVTGTYIQNTVINEMSNPLTLNPIEYGRVKIMNLSSSTTSTDLRFEQSGVVEGNLSLENGKIKLTAGKTYAITMKIGFDGTTSCEINASLMSDSSGVLTGVLHKAQDVVSKYSTNLNNSCLYTPQVDDTIYCVNTWSSMSGQTYMLEVNVQEVRNNPVNQYGGFETEVLFEGSANNNNSDYLLSDDIMKYDYLYVISSPSGNHNYSTNVIVVSDIDYSIEGQYMNSTYSGNVEGTEYYYSINYSFTDSKTLHIHVARVKGWTSPQITKIIGVKGQIPSLLVGGEF